MQQRNADRTRARILAAATEEFAERGIAGARVQRIAEVADCNKAMLYAYFGSKDGLFDAVFSASVEEYLTVVGFDTSDLPAYAGRLFDYFEDNPARLRLTSWYRLERPDGKPLEAVLAVNHDRLEELERAQRRRTVPKQFSAVTLLSLIQAIATSWSSMTPEYGAAAPSRIVRRRAVVAAVEKILS
ncbi:TetR/AcrR family transcriptional regulator [Kribbella sandramycini]|uniref:AcrR family transcriptional regulator n=1 Tax=Kribbella sandramycini TaxID=60450 RepID=A0A7Y4L4T9_9ACTN|nr:TetR family transcriptional regulator [Kribbella sandramycini]MBB6571757.1 AcrR family transcriptional regulator [Kribbella sandramycini]NOL44400.1 TetR/AcrR family transcriptional regulator [Kribbella sandramycini]